MSSSDPSKALHNEINIPDIQYYSNSLPAGNGQLKERCGLEGCTNFFSFKKVAKTRCGLDSRIYTVCIFVCIFVHTCFHFFRRCYTRFGAYPDHMHITVNVKKQLVEKKIKRKKQQHSFFESPFRAHVFNV
jgi:hypothetical protein